MSVENLKKSIQKSKNISLDKFIFSLGIRHIGQENAKLLSEFLKNKENFFRLKNQNYIHELINIDGIGDTQIRSIDDFFSNKKNSEIIQSLMLVLNIKDMQKISQNGLFINKNIMFTGGFEKMSRSEAKAIAEENGAKILGSVSKKLNYLVIGNSKPTKKKIEKAKELKINIMTEENWYKLLNR